VRFIILRDGTPPHLLDEAFMFLGNWKANKETSETQERGVSFNGSRPQSEAIARIFAISGSASLESSAYPDLSLQFRSQGAAHGSISSSFQERKI